jgi:hypothetical protein
MNSMAKSPQYLHLPGLQASLRWVATVEFFGHTTQASQEYIVTSKVVCSQWGNNLGNAWQEIKVLNFFLAEMIV